ncbi:MAG: hypothetical protein AAF297_11760 [Planctomycetota bacterium]
MATPPDNGPPIPFDPLRDPAPNGGRPLDDAPDELLEQARRRVRTRRDEDEYGEQGKKLARRILIAFILILLTAAAFFVILPSMGLKLHPVVPLASFATIAIGAVLTHLGDKPPPFKDPNGPIDINATQRDRPLPPGNRLP